MNKYNKWRLVSDVLAIFPTINSDCVYITNMDDKKQETLIAKRIEKDFGNSSYNKITVNNEFYLRIYKGGLQIKSDKFIDSSKWYYVVNFAIETLYDIIPKVKNDLGVFNETLEAIFNDEIPDSVSFINQSMDNYVECFEEMGRRVVCDMSKKTKKRIPGHRYDSVDRSLYYLGSFMSRDNNGIYALDENMVPVDLYATNITKEDKKISDVFKNHIIGKDIIVESITSLVDFGEVLENDFDKDDIQNYWKYLFDNAVKEAIKAGCRCIPGNYGRVLKLFSYQSSSNLEYKNLPNVEGYLKKILWELIKNNWDKENNFRKENTIKNNKSKDENIVGLVNLFYANLSDPNIYKDSYYASILKQLGISLSKLASETLDDWNNLDMFKNWETFVEYYNCVGLSFISDQRTKEVTNTDIKQTKISDLFSETLKNVIIEIAYNANDNFGLNIKRYKVVNLGTKRTPREYTEIVITLNDIIKSGKLNENIKKEIMDYKFKDITLFCNKGGKLE